MSTAPAVEPLQVKRRSSARSFILLTVATLLCFLPLSGKAFHLDDPLFLWSARQITKHPLRPYGFQINWYGQLTPMSKITKNPPLACYYSAVIGGVAGFSERAMHLGFLLPALAMVLGTYRLAQRFTRSPLIAATATLLTPGVLVSANSVMCDTLMLAFWIWAVIFWLEGLDLRKQGYLLGAAVLMAAAALTKYFGICLVPLLLAYSVAKQRKLGAWVGYFLLPLAALAGYQFWTQALYGLGMFTDALQFAPQRITNAWFRAGFYPLVCTSFIGGCALPALTLAPLVWSRRYILIAILLEAISIAIGWAIMGSYLRTIPMGILIQQLWKTAGLELAVYIAGGVSALALAAVDIWELRDADSLLLALWVFGTFVFAAFLNWTINARSVLPLIPALGILVARRLDKLGVASLRPLQTRVAMALFVSGFFSFWIAYADADWANSAKQMAEVLQQRTKDAPGTVWFQGHWGFQYYMEQMGVHPFDSNTTTLRPGDILIVPKVDYTSVGPPRQFVDSVELQEIPLQEPVATLNSTMGAGFYSSTYGPLPFAFGKVPPERYAIFHIGRTLRPEQWPPAVFRVGLP